LVMPLRIAQDFARGFRALNKRKHDASQFEEDILTGTMLGNFIKNTTGTL